MELRKPGQQNATPKATAITVSNIKVFVFDSEVLYLQPTTKELQQGASRIKS